jgi:hypothetical protein
VFKAQFYTTKIVEDLKRQKERKSGQLSIRTLWISYYSFCKVSTLRWRRRNLLCEEKLGAIRVLNLLTICIILNLSQSCTAKHFNHREMVNRISIEGNKEY